MQIKSLNGNTLGKQINLVQICKVRNKTMTLRNFKRTKNSQILSQLDIFEKKKSHQKQNNKSKRSLIYFNDSNLLRPTTSVVRKVLKQQQNKQKLNEEQKNSKTHKTSFDLNRLAVDENKLKKQEKMCLKSSTSPIKIKLRKKDQNNYLINPYTNKCYLYHCKRLQKRAQLALQEINRINKNQQIKLSCKINIIALSARRSSQKSKYEGNKIIKRLLSERKVNQQSMNISGLDPWQNQNGNQMLEISNL